MTPPSRRPVLPTSEAGDAMEGKSGRPDPTAGDSASFGKKPAPQPPDSMRSESTRSHPVPGATLLAITVAAMREPVNLGHTRSLSWRIEQLKRLETLVQDHSEEVLAALAADLGKPEVEASFELVAIREELAHTRRHLRRWLRPRTTPLPLWALPGTAWVQQEPLGCVLIIGPWNYPFQLVIQPLVSALAAGNTAILKPSELAPHTAELIARLVARHFPREVVQVVVGDGAVAARLLEETFDHIFFTGGGRVGRLVMAAAARHLTPVTLELGGKSPAIVLEDADVSLTARRLLWGKAINAGQTCVAPDHLYVVPRIREALIQSFAEELGRFYNDNPLGQGDLARIINQPQFDRLERLLHGARQRGQIMLGGRSDPSSRRIEPTLVAVDADKAGLDPLMQEELFGPLLPVIEVADLEGALCRVRAGEKPLALYLFGGGAQERQHLLNTTSSGGVAFNDVILQAGISSLTFGGVGESGMGQYHGEEGFRTFSHQRAVVRRRFWPEPSFRFPPYAGKMKLIKRLLG